MTSPDIDRADIQGDILRAYGNAYDCTSYVFTRVDDAAEGRAWLKEIAPRVRSDESWTGPKPETHLNLAFTYRGLLALGVPEHVADSFSDEFREGMAERASLLGDRGESDPDRWDGRLGTGAAHVMLTVNGQTREQTKAELDRLSAEAEAAGVEVLHAEHAALLEGAREHFGYADGFAQPAIEGVNEDRANGGGVPLADGRWRPLALGEFILGYPDEDSRDDPGRLPTAPADPLGRNGTYVVWRKLHQDVALFRQVMRDAAELYEDGDELKLRAKVVGRWPDGTPLVTSPETPTGPFDPLAPGANDFRYAEPDREGMRCPLGAHIRRSNPRDALGWEGRLSFRHRMIRRGMPYGPPLPEGEEDNKDRGLVFVCFNASISRQFESVQVQWLNSGNIFGLGLDKDFILGDATGAGKMTVAGRPPFFLAPQASFVTTRGGEYLFAPGLTALQAIADGVTG